MLSAKAKFLSIAATAMIAAAAIAIVTTQAGAWKKWRAHRYANRAEALVRTGAKEAARIACMRALTLDRDCLPAVRALLLTLPAGDVRNALLLRVRLADLAPGDHENLRRLALTAIRAQRYDLAETAARDLARALGETVEVLELRARIPAARGDFPAAAKAARALLDRDPGNVAGRLILALTQVFTRAPIAATERELTDLSKVATVRIEALRGLREAALQRGDQARARELAEAAAADPRADFTDRLVRAELTAQAQTERSEELLAELTLHAGSDPHALGLIAAWLRKTGRADHVEPWVAASEALRRDPLTAQLIRAETFAAQGAWGALDALLADAHWRELDFLRLALQARAARERGDDAAFSKAWRAATKSALADANTMRMLVDTVRTWPDWDAELEALLWQAAKSRLGNSAWVLTELFRRAAARQDTRGLRRISEAMCEANPANEPAQNNLAFYSLLLAASPDRAHRLAEELYAAHPAEAPIASTYALSLLQRGRAAEALAALEKLPAEILQRAELAPYHALALTAVGEREKAQLRAAQVAAADLLPEERELLRSAGLPLKP